MPDLVVFGKAVANGYPIAVHGGKRRLMDFFVHSDPSKHVLLAGSITLILYGPQPPSQPSSAC